MQACIFLSINLTIKQHIGKRWSNIYNILAEGIPGKSGEQLISLLLCIVR